MAEKTLWTHPEAKWKPRNVQAARIMFPAKGIHLPPEEPAVNVLEQRKQEAKEARIRAEIAAKNIAEHQAAILLQQKKDRELQREKRKNKEPNYTWLARHLRRMAKLRGRPVPSKDEIKKSCQAYAAGQLLLA